MGHSVIIVHSSFFLSSRFRSLWATCMTVTMTASGAQLLLLALCVYGGWGLQQSAPRVRLSFKGELVPDPLKLPLTVGFIIIVYFTCLVSSTPTHTHTSPPVAIFPFCTYVKKVFPATCQTVPHWKQKVDITCGCFLVVPFDRVSSHTLKHTRTDLSELPCFLMSDTMTLKRKHLKFDHKSKMIFHCSLLNSGWCRLCVCVCKTSYVVQIWDFPM